MEIWFALKETRRLVLYALPLAGGRLHIGDLEIVFNVLGLDRSETEHAEADERRRSEFPPSCPRTLRSISPSLRRGRGELCTP